MQHRIQTVIETPKHWPATHTGRVPLRNRNPFPSITALWKSHFSVIQRQFFLWSKNKFFIQQKQIFMVTTAKSWKRHQPENRGYSWCYGDFLIKKIIFTCSKCTFFSTSASLLRGNLWQREKKILSDSFLSADFIYFAAESLASKSHPACPVKNINLQQNMISLRAGSVTDISKIFAITHSNTMKKILLFIKLERKSYHLKFRT